MLYAFPLSLYVPHAQIILFSLITHTIFGEQHTSWSSAVFSLLQLCYMTLGTLISKSLCCVLFLYQWQSFTFIQNSRRNYSSVYFSLCILRCDTADGSKQFGQPCAGFLTQLWMALYELATEGACPYEYPWLSALRPLENELQHCGVCREMHSNWRTKLWRKYSETLLCVWYFKWGILVLASAIWKYIFSYFK
jgi:hypothetical protein